MALGPQLQRKSRERLLKRAEKRIDEAIRESVSLDITIATKLLEGIDSNDWDTILKPKYIQAGWRMAKWMFDPRDGDYIQLKA